MDSKNLAIGVLTVTATILFVGLVIVNSIGGDYLVVTGQQRSERELLYVIDAGGRTERLAAYVFDRDRGQLVMASPPIDLNRLRPPRIRR